MEKKAEFSVLFRKNLIYDSPPITLFAEIFLETPIDFQ